MRQTRTIRSTVAVVASLLLTMPIVGCEPPQKTVTPVITTTNATSSPSYSPYITTSNYQFVLFSPAFAVADSIASVDTYDNKGNQVTSWTCVMTGANAPSQNQTNKTFTVLLTPAANSNPLSGGPGHVKPDTVTSGGPAGSGTVVVNTTNNVAIPIPVISVTTDPCGLK